MTKKDIARSIAETSGLTIVQTQRIIQMMMDTIVAALIAERRMELRGFGVFEVAKRKARHARNPRTGESVFVPERLVVTFNAGSGMECRVGANVNQQAEMTDAA